MRGRRRVWFDPLPRDLARVIWEELDTVDRSMLCIAIDPDDGPGCYHIQAVYDQMMSFGYVKIRRWFISNIWRFDRNHWYIRATRH